MGYDMYTSASLPELPNKVNANSAILGSDDALQKHVLKVQETLLESVDRQVSLLENKLFTKEDQISRVLDEKKDIAIGFYKLKHEYERSSNQNRKLAKRATQLETDKKLVESSLVNLKRQIGDKDKHVLAAKAEEQKAKGVAEDYERKFNRMQKLNLMLATDLKVQHHVQQILKKESESLVSKRKQAKGEAIAATKEAEAQITAKKAVEQALLQQKQETTVAQNALGKTVKELSQLQQASALMEKQWTDAMQALNKRDVTMQAIQQSKEKAQFELEEAKQKMRAFQQEKDEAKKQLHAKEFADKAFTDGIHDLETRLQEVTQKAKLQSQDLASSQKAQDMYRVALEKAEKHAAFMSEAHLRKQKEAQEYKKKCIQSETLAESAREEAIHLAELKVEEQLASKFEEKTNKIAAVLAHDSYQVRRENAQLKLQMQLKENNSVQKDYKLQQVESNYNDAQEQVQEMSHDIKMLSSTLERREHELHIVQARLENKRVKDNQVPALKGEIANLNKALVIARQEQDKIQVTWLSTKKESLKDRQELEKLKLSYNNNQTKLSAAEVIKDSALSEVDNWRAENIETQIQLAQAQLLNKKILPQVSKYKADILGLEHLVAAAQINTQIAHVEGRTAAQILQTQIRHLSKAKNQLKRNQNLDLKTHMAMEKRLTLAKAMLDKEISQKKYLAKENTQLKQKLVNSEAGMAALKSEYQRYIEQSMRRSIERKSPAPIPAEFEGQIRLWNDNADSAANCSVAVHGNSYGTVENGAWHDLLPKSENSIKSAEDLVNQPMQVSHASPLEDAANIEKSNPEVDFGLISVKNINLRLATLQREKAFLLDENTHVMNQINDLKREVEQHRQQRDSDSAKIDLLETELKSTTQKLNLLARQFERATNLAASIEQQFKESVPNVKIDYNLSKNVDQSPQILGALMYKNSTVVSI